MSLPKLRAAGAAAGRRAKAGAWASPRPPAPASRPPAAKGRRPSAPNRAARPWCAAGDEGARREASRAERKAGLRAPGSGRARRGGGSGGGRRGAQGPRDLASQCPRALAREALTASNGARPPAPPRPCARPRACGVRGAGRRWRSCFAGGRGPGHAGKPRPGRRHTAPCWAVSAGAPDAPPLHPASRLPAPGPWLRPVPPPCPSAALEGEAVRWGGQGWPLGSRLGPGKEGWRLEFSSGSGALGRGQGVEGPLAADRGAHGRSGSKAGAGLQRGAPSCPFTPFFFRLAINAPGVSLIGCGAAPAQSSPHSRSRAAVCGSRCVGFAIASWL